MNTSNAQTPDSAKSGHLVRGIGLLSASFLILNGMIGSGIFALPSAIAANAGILSPWLFLGVGLLFISVVLTFAELSSYFRQSGGSVLYTTVAFGALAGFNTGWLLFLSRLASFAANTNVMVIYLATLIPQVAEGPFRILLIILICGSITFANVLGVKDGVRTMASFTVLKLTPLIVMILLGLPYVGGEVLLPANMPTIDDLGGTTLLLIYAFIGFEQVTISAGETRQPRRTIPKALVITIVATGILYFLITRVYVSTLPGGGGEGQTLVDVGRVVAGSAGALAITLAAIFSIGGNLASSMLSAPRITFALAEERLLPPWFGRIHPKYGTPYNSIIFLGGLAAILAISGSFIYLATASSLSRLISYILSIAALPAIRKRAKGEAESRAFRLKGGLLIPAIAMILCLWIAAQSKAESWLFVGGLLLVGLFLFWLEKRANR